MTAAQHSSASCEWGTAPEIVELGREVLDGIDVDPCSSEYWNRHVVKAAHWTGVEDGPLIGPEWRWGHEWPDASYLINPPGGLVRQFFAFALARWAEESPALWVGFSLEQLPYLQGQGLMHRDIIRAILPKRLAYLQSRRDAIARIEQRIAEAAKGKRKALGATELAKLSELREDPDGPPVVGPSPTHGSYLALLPTTMRQARLFRAGVERLGAVPW